MTELEFKTALVEAARACDRVIMLFPEQSDRNALFQLFQQFAADATLLSLLNIEPS